MNCFRKYISANGAFTRYGSHIVAHKALLRRTGLQCKAMLLSKYLRGFLDADYMVNNVQTSFAVGVTRLNEIVTQTIFNIHVVYIEY